MAVWFTRFNMFGLTLKVILEHITYTYTTGHQYSAPLQLFLFCRKLPKLSYIFYIFVPISTGKKGTLTLIIKRSSIRNIQDWYGHVYTIYSWSGSKNQTSVRPSAKLLYIKTWERTKINACGCFCLKGVYWESSFPTRSHEDLRS